MIAFLMGLDTVAPQALHARLQRGAVRVYDVNSASSWREARVPGARHLDAETYTAAELDAATDVMLVFYCSGPFCRKAPRAARRALRMGYADVRVMAAGLRGWLEAGLPAERGVA